MPADDRFAHRHISSIDSQFHTPDRNIIDIVRSETDREGSRMMLVIDAVGDDAKGTKYVVAALRAKFLLHDFEFLFGRRAAIDSREHIADRRPLGPPNSTSCRIGITAQGLHRIQAYSYWRNHEDSGCEPSNTAAVTMLTFRNRFCQPEGELANASKKRLVAVPYSRPRVELAHVGATRSAQPGPQIDIINEAGEHSVKISEAGVPETTT